MPLFIVRTTLFLSVLLSSVFSTEVEFSTPFYSTTINGDMTTIGNTIVWKDTTASNLYGVDISTSTPTDRNNAYTMKFVDVLNDGSTTFNSSSATLNLSAGYTVEWAGLYWQGHIVNKNLENNADNTKLSSVTGTASSKNTARYDEAKTKANSIYFRLPNGTNYNLTAESFYDYPTNYSSGIDRRYLYSGFYNVTNYVQSGGNGEYIVGNIATSEGQMNEWGGFGGWAMLIVYKDPTGSLHLKNISVFHGFQILSNGETDEIDISGFLTPSAGTINASMATFVVDGDKLGSFSTGEHLKLWNTANVLTDITNTLNPSSNIFNSSISNLNTDNVIRTPSFSDNLGFDLDTFDVSSYMKNGQSSTKIEVSTDGDLYAINMIAFATDVYSPDVCYIETIFDPSGTKINGEGVQVNLDDNLTVRVYIKNNGLEDANKVQIIQDFNSSFPYIVNSTNYNNSNPGYETTITPSYARTSATDSSGDDLFDYNSSIQRTTINLGVGASTASGGDFTPFTADGTNAAYEYKLTIMATDVNYSNIYKAAYVNSALGIDYSNNPVQIYTCDGSNNSFWGYKTPIDPKKADIIDTFNSISSYNAGTDKVIKTKIANKSPDTITAVYLNDANEAETFSTTTGVDYSVIPYWADATCTIQENVLDTSGTQIVIDIPNGNASQTGQIQVRDKAMKQARFVTIVVDPNALSIDGVNCILNSSTTGNFARVAQCANSEVQYRAAFGDDAWSRCGESRGKPCTSSNHGVANTNDPTYNASTDAIFTNDLGCYLCTFDASPQCSTDDFAIRPEKFQINTTLLINPDKDHLKAGEDYNLTVTATEFGTTNATQSYDQTKANLNIYAGTKYLKSGAIDNTLDGTANFGTGNFNFTNGTTTNMGITYDNVGKITLDINDSNWAAIDATDNGITMADMLIEGEVNVTFIPFDFNITNLTLANHQNSNFTYLSNDLNMSAIIPFTVQAQNKQGTVTTNYANFPLWENNVTVSPSIHSTSLNKDANISAPLLQDLNFVNGIATIFWNDANITRFNFQRDINSSIDPFDVNGTDLNMTITDADGVYGEANQTATGSVKFYYGRVHVPDVEGISPLDVIVRYEVYCKDCNKTDHNITGTQSPDSANWYENAFHDGSTFGSVATFSSIGGSTKLNLSKVTSGVILDGKEELTLTNISGIKNYVDRILMTPSTAKWLIYNPFNSNATYNDFSATFYERSGWAGLGNLGLTIDDNTTTNVTRINRRIDW